jgi:hypothetical protein
MKTFFSIIYLTLNANLKERISVGMIMSNGEKSLFRFSNNKLGIIKNLIPPQNYTFLKTYFKNLDGELNYDFENNLELDLRRETTNQWINEKYFGYLSRYSNNLIQFSQPKSIEISLNSEDFEKLFHKYIFEKDDESTAYRPNDFLHLVKTKLYSKIEAKVNIDAVVNPDDFKELIAPVNVNFIGKNGQIVAGQAIDFAKKFYNLENDLTRFISFTKAVDFEKGKGHYFLVGEEPNKGDIKNHNIWKHIFESKMVDYVGVDEIDKIQKYIDSHGVTPYFANFEASS